MLNPQIHIIITNPNGSRYLDINFCNEVEIERSRKNLTATCKIKMPRKIKVIDGNINEFFVRGSKVEVYLGYYPNLKLEFTGYIARVDARVPFLISCEDEMWKLKQNSFTKSFKNPTLKEVVNYVYAGPSKVADLKLGGFVIKQQSTAQVLDALKKFALQCYFDENGVLIADFAGVVADKPTEVYYDFSKNVIDPDLDYVRKEDLRIKVKGVSKLPNGKKYEFTSGDPDGDERTLHYYNLDQDALKKIVAKELDKLKIDGYKNDFTTFGEPYCFPGYAGVLHDPDYPERDGSYLVEAVTTTFGVNGFRRKITPERRLA
ncbi:MAG: hypothetical protein IE931_05505 [Sphingobacteriales bacterium]|nr:hypothetical protein [Sphingobacteriales bacterium]